MPGETLISLVRHGATSWNEAGKFQGQQDVPLAETGFAQARRAGEALVGLAGEFGYSGWAALYTSPLSRARQTAAEIGRWLGLQPRELTGLMERAFGAIEGLTRAQVEAMYPSWWERPESVPGLETEGALRARALKTMSALAEAHPGEAVVAVTHGGLINAFLRQVGAKRPGEGWKPLHNGGITVVAGRGLSWRVLRLNQADHLLDSKAPPPRAKPGEA